MTRLPPLYLPYENGREHAFARRLREFAIDDPPGSILLLHAPTGAGKTRSLFAIAEKQQGVLLTVPTNALAAEVEEAYEVLHPGRVARWNADAFKTKGTKRHEEMINQAWEKDLVVSNPDMLHLFTQHHYAEIRRRMRLSGFGMRNFGLLVFDEYHAYDERVLAAVLLYVLKSRGAGNYQRFVFMSATEDEGLRGALEQLRLEFKEAIVERPTAEPMSGERGRAIRGSIEVEVSDAPLVDALPARPRDTRALFIFSTFLEQQRAVRMLQERGFPEENVRGGFVQITGRKTRSSHGQDPWTEATSLLATSKVEVGLNIEGLDEVYLEPGRSEQQFWQRFGRGGRSGRSARIGLHFPGYPAELLVPLRAATDYESLTLAIGALLRPEAAHVDTILRFVGAYAASYRDLTPRSEDRDVVEHAAFEGLAAQGFGLVSKMFANYEKDELADEVGGSREWMATVRRSLRGLRGQALEVRTSYAWGLKDEIVGEDLLFVITRTDADRPDAGGVYRVTEFLPRPREALLRYRILDGAEVRIPTRGFLNRKEFRRLPDAIASAVRREMGGELPAFWDALTGWLSLVPPDEIRPSGVDADDLFV